MAKHVFVTGGVASSLGKGLTASSLGRLLKSRGLRVTMQKLDPATLGEHRDAIQLLDHALDDHRRAQTPPWIAQSTRALAELDARRR